MKIVCIGESLIDFVCTEQDISLTDGKTFIKEAGGAPANVAACIARLGGESHFVGAVGRDPFGQYLIDTLETYGVNCQYIQSRNEPTSLAFVSLFADGERDFVFNRGADEQLAIDESTLSELTTNSIVHLGSATALLGGPLYDSYRQLVNAAHINNNIVCFDPNFRIDLWRGKEAEFIEKCHYFLSSSQLVKVSEEELLLLTGETDQNQACSKLHEFGVQFVLVTLGSKGCLLSDGVSSTVIPAYEVDVIDTTGAGDSFIGAILYQLASDLKGEALTTKRLKGFAQYASKVSALVCSQLGAMSSLPTPEDLEQFHSEIKETINNK